MMSPEENGVLQDVHYNLFNYMLQKSATAEVFCSTEQPFINLQDYFNLTRVTHTERSQVAYLKVMDVQHMYILLTVRKCFMTQCMLPNFVYQHRNSYCTTYLSFVLFLHFLWTLARSKVDFLQFSLEIIIKQRHKNDIHAVYKRKTIAAILNQTYLHPLELCLLLRFLHEW